MLVQPPARRPDVSLYRLGTEPVFFDRAQSMDPQTRKTKCRLNTLLTPNPSCEVSTLALPPVPVKAFRNIVVYPTQELLRHLSDGAFFRGGPDWPHFVMQIHARHRWNLIPRPADRTARSLRARGSNAVSGAVRSATISGTWWPISQCGSPRPAGST